MPNTSFGIWLQQEMEKQGINSTRELGRRMGGVAHTTIRRWMEGKSDPNLDQIRKLERALGVPALRILQELNFAPNLDEEEVRLWVAYLKGLDPREREILLDLARVRFQRRQAAER